MTGKQKMNNRPTAIRRMKKAKIFLVLSFPLKSTHFYLRSVNNSSNTWNFPLESVPINKAFQIFPTTPIQTVIAPTQDQSDLFWHKNWDNSRTKTLMTLNARMNAWLFKEISWDSSANTHEAVSPWRFRGNFRTFPSPWACRIKWWTNASCRNGRRKEERR